MERLTFGYGVPRRQVESPEVHRPAEPPREAEVRPIVADPLPGESSDWAYFGLLAFTALLFFRPQDQLPFLESFHLAELSAVVGLVAMGVKRLARRLPPVHLTPELVGLLAFGLVLVGTTPFSFWPGGSVEVITGLYLKVLLIVVLMMNSLTTPTRLQRFTSLVIVASAYLSIRAVVDYLRGVNLVEGGRVAGAVQGIFGNPNDLAMNMVAFLPFAALLAVLAMRTPVLRRSRRSRDGAAPEGVAAEVGRAPRTAPGSRGGKADAVARISPAPAVRPATFTRLVSAVAVVLMLLAIVFTKSRGGTLGLAGMFLALIYYGRKIKPGVAVGAIAVIVVLLPLVPSTFWSRMSSITDEDQDATGSRAARRQVMTEAFDVFVERPLTGIGAGQFKNYNPPGKKERWREAHDVWLQVASETGIFGVLAFAYLVVSAFRAASWSRKRLAACDTRQSTDLGILRMHASALVPSLVGWFVCAIFASVAYNWTFYYLLGLGIATRQLTRDALAARSFAPVVGRPERARARRAPAADPVPAH